MTPRLPQRGGVGCALSAAADNSFQKSTDTQAEAILETKLRHLAKLEEVKKKPNDAGTVAKLKSLYEAAVKAVTTAESAGSGICRRNCSS